MPPNSWRFSSVVIAPNASLDFLYSKPFTISHNFKCLFKPCPNGDRRCLFVHVTIFCSGFNKKTYWEVRPILHDPMPRTPQGGLFSFKYDRKTLTDASFPFSVPILVFTAFLSSSIFWNSVVETSPNLLLGAVGPSLPSALAAIFLTQCLYLLGLPRAIFSTLITNGFPVYMAFCGLTTCAGFNQSTRVKKIVYII